MKEHEVSRYTFRSSRPVASGHRVLVWRSAGGQVYPVTSPPTTGELMLGSFQAYEVDVSQHPIQIGYDLPSRDSAMTFRAVLRATWQVTDPTAVVREGIANAEAVHHAWLNQLLRDAGSRYSIFDQEVEQQINATLAPLVGHTRNGVSVIDLRVEISLDESTAAFVRGVLDRNRRQEERMDVAEKDAELARRKAELEVLQAETDRVLQAQRQQNEQELRARQAEHDKVLALGEAELRLKLEAQAKEQELVLAQKKERHDLEMKQMRMGFYAEAFKQGNSSLLILQLVEHPEDTGVLVRFLLDQRKVAFENSREMLKALIEADAISPASLDEASQVALSNVLKELRPAVAGLTLPEAPPAAITGPEEDPRRDPAQKSVDGPADTSARKPAQEQVEEQLEKPVEQAHKPAGPGRADDDPVEYE